MEQPQQFPDDHAGSENVTAVPPIPTDSHQSLNSLSCEILDALEDEDEYIDGALLHASLAVGQSLIEAQKQVPPDKWAAWLEGFALSAESAQARMDFALTWAQVDEERRRTAAFIQMESQYSSLIRYLTAALRQPA